MPVGGGGGGVVLNPAGGGGGGGGGRRRRWGGRPWGCGLAAAEDVSWGWGGRGWRDVDIHRGLCARRHGWRGWRRRFRDRRQRPGSSGLSRGHGGRGRL